LLPWLLLSALRALAQLQAVHVDVTTPEQFQEQVRLGTPHIVITQHLNMAASPRFSVSTIMDDAIIAIVKAPNNSRITQSIRVRWYAPTEELITIQYSARFSFVSWRGAGVVMQRAS
jgi:hypothetical protein